MSSSGSLIDTLAQDLSYALRQLHRNPGFAAAAVLTLALGIGANAAIYQVLDAVVFRSLPVRDPASLVQVQVLENNQPIHVSYPFYRELAGRQRVLDSLFAVSDFPLRQAVLRGRGSLRTVKGCIVTGNYFRALGVPARLGRVFTEDDDRPAAPPVIVLSDAFWSREFARSPSVLGQTLEINGLAGTVIGVTPPDFFGETVGTLPDFWLPMSVQPHIMPNDYLNAPSSSWLSMLGRLRPGSSARQAEAALGPLYRALSELTITRPGQDYRVQLQSASRGIAQLEQRFGRPLWVLIGITGLVLLIACGNLANLMLGRATARTQEIGVRLALGAARSRIVRQLLTESLLLSALGTTAALLLATAGARALVAWASAAGDWRLSLSFEWRHLHSPPPSQRRPPVSSPSPQPGPPHASTSMPPCNPAPAPAPADASAIAWADASSWPSSPFPLPCSPLPRSWSNPSGTSATRISDSTSSMSSRRTSLSNSPRP